MTTTPPVDDIYIVDATALIFRNFHVNREYALNSKGIDTTAINGFFTSLNILIKDVNPRNIALVFDPPGGSFRQEISADYKQNRKPIDPQLAIQIRPIQDLCRAFGFRVLTLEGYEADDVIGTLAKHFSAKNFKVLVESKDKDFVQLIDDNISLIDSSKKPAAFYDKENGHERFGVPLECSIDYLAIVGDVADNIPGVKGVGEKTAQALLNQYGGLDSIYRHIDAGTFTGKIGSKKAETLAKSLVANKEAAYQSYELATIHTDIAIANVDDLASYKINDWDIQAIYNICQEFELARIHNNFSKGLFSFMLLEPENQEKQAKKALAFDAFKTLGPAPIFKANRVAKDDPAGELAALVGAAQYGYTPAINRLKELNQEGTIANLEQPLPTDYTSVPYSSQNSASVVSQHAATLASQQAATIASLIEVPPEIKAKQDVYARFAGTHDQFYAGNSYLPVVPAAQLRTLIAQAPESFAQVEQVAQAGDWQQAVDAYTKAQQERLAGADFGANLRSARLARTLLSFDSWTFSPADALAYAWLGQALGLDAQAQGQCLQELERSLDLPTTIQTTQTPEQKQQLTNAVATLAQAKAWAQQAAGLVADLSSVTKALASAKRVTLNLVPNLQGHPVGISFLAEQNLSPSNNGDNNGDSTPAIKGQYFEFRFVGPESVGVLAEKGPSLPGYQGLLAAVYDFIVAPLVQRASVGFTNFWGKAAEADSKLEPVVLLVNDAKYFAHLFGLSGHQLDALAYGDKATDTQGFHDVRLLANTRNSQLSGDSSFSQVAEHFCGISIQPYSFTATKTDYEVIWNSVANSTVFMPYFFELAKDTTKTELYRTIEAPLLGMLYKMEASGIKLDSAHLERIEQDLQTRISACEKQIFALAGKEFNYNSSPQTAEVLYDILMLEDLKQRSTAAEVLRLLDHPIIEPLLQIRSLTTILSTHVVALKQYAINSVDSFVHTTFLQNTAVTGRLSSVNPNLQNVPSRGDFAKEIRASFVAQEGYTLVSCDYSQIELRIAAYLSKDANMQQAFIEDKDIHSQTASKLFNTESPTPDQRQVAKAINFGLNYGKTAFSLSNELKIARNEATNYVNEYFNVFAGVKENMTRLKNQAQKYGFVESICGRIINLPNINSAKRAVADAERRSAINYPIQCSAAEVIKLAMNKLNTQLATQAPEVIPLLQIHDELLFAIPTELVDKYLPLITQTMESCIDLSPIPLKVGCAISDHWTK